MMSISDKAYEDLYQTAMDGIGCKVALQAIRKIVRDNKITEKDKLGQIITVVHSFERDMERKGENLDADNK